MKFGSKNTIKFTQQQTLGYKNCILDDRVMKKYMQTCGICYLLSDLIIGRLIHYRYIPFIKIYTVYRSQWAIQKI